MKNHYFEANPTYPEECRRCGDSHDAPIHELDGVPVGDAEDEGPDDMPGEDWPPNVVAYLEAVGIRQPA